MKSLLPLIVFIIHYALSEDCKAGEKVKLQEGLLMKCKEGKWIKIERKNRKGPGAQPCEDNPAMTASGTCSTDEGHCRQFTVKGQEMDKDCPGTCDSCDECRCQDNHQWFKYCSYWTQYCDAPGMLGTWMSTNCKKTCHKCTCPCCSYQGKKHALGARILLPEKCGELLCEEGMKAGSSSLLPGATLHKVSHPDELTLNFRAVHQGVDCCVLPADGKEEDGSVVVNGTMVKEGWTGTMSMSIGSIQATCCHGTMSVALADVKNGTITTSTKGPVWRKIFSHDTAGGLFANLDETKKKNVGDESALLFSMLYDLENMRNDDGVFHFKLCHPELTQFAFPCNEWTQSSNPVTEETITGYVALNITFNRFGGLGLATRLNSNENLIDKTPTDSNWWDSIGTLKWFGSGKIPGPEGSQSYSVKKKELYVYY